MVELFQFLKTMPVEEIKKIIDSITDFKEKNDFAAAYHQIFVLLENLDKNDLVLNQDFKYASIRIINEVFCNKFFIDAVKNYDSTEGSEINDNGSFVKVSLNLGFSLLSFIYEVLDQNFVLRLKEEIKSASTSLNSKLEKKYLNYELFNIFYQIVNNKGINFPTSGVYFPPAFFKHLVVSINLVKIMAIDFHSSKLLEDEFKKIIKNHEIMDRFSLWTALSIVKQKIEFRNLKISGILSSKYGNFKAFLDLFEDKNTVNTFFIISTFLKTFDFTNVDSDFRRDINVTIKVVIASSAQLKQEIFSFCSQHLKAFGGALSLNERNIEWSNKIFLITNKTLSTFEALSHAKDPNWVYNVFVFEMYRWLDDVHVILNKYELEDDWNQIKDYLHEENNIIEWKSTFLTPTEDLYVNEETEKSMGSRLLKLVANAILGMINTEGGVILVGLVENPEKIKRDDIKKMLFKKNGVTFFDINYEFKKKNILGADNIKRRIQDCLSQETKIGVDVFNNLWSIKSVEIKSNYKSQSIYKIEVQKGPKPFFSVENNWITLIKRADGRTVEKNPADLF